MDLTEHRQCARCDGCGRVVGTGREERAWSAFRDLPLHLVLEKLFGMRTPWVCPDCGGTGRASDGRPPATNGGLVH
jgi:transposase